MTGHQAEFWHPGILAKYLAADAAARAIRARGHGVRVVWLVADQDSNDPSAIQYPAASPSGPVRALWKPAFRGATTSSDAFVDVPTSALPVLDAAGQAGVGPALPCVSEGLGRMASALRAHAGASSAGGQITGALCDLLRPHAAPDEVVYASELYRLGAFSELLERMRSDPAGCTRAYNAAAARFPRARVRPLIDQPGRLELPLWRMPDGPLRPRRPVFAADLPDTEPAHLAPRALLMTAIVRLEACDLFIHGTGGGVYDQVTDAWLSAWLPGRALAPTAVVTATRFLPFRERVPSPEEIERARWRAHHARHDPGELGDSAAAARKQELLVELRTARSRGQSPSVAFGKLHTLLDETRRTRAEVLGQFESGAAAALGQRRLAEVVYDRTWPFPL